MVAEAQTLEEIVTLAEQLSPEYRLRLIERIVQTLIQPPPVQKSAPLQYGKYNTGKMSTLEDFAITEWR